MNEAQMREFEAWYFSKRGLAYTGNPTAEETKSVWCDGWQAAHASRQPEIDALKQNLFAADMLLKMRAKPLDVSDYEKELAALNAKVAYLESYIEAQKESFDEVAQGNIALQAKVAMLSQHVPEAFNDFPLLPNIASARLKDALSAIEPEATKWLNEQKSDAFEHCANQFIAHREGAPLVSADEIALILTGIAKELRGE